MMNFDKVIIYDHHSNVCAALLDRVEVRDNTAYVIDTVARIAYENKVNEVVIYFPDYGAYHKYHELYKESIMRMVAGILLPCLLLYGAYVLLNGQISPGGGFSGGAVIGSGLIICAAAFGFVSTDRVITKRAANLIAFFSLGFYSFAKGYVFFTGANGMENHIPKGTPGAILSGGLILPLDIAVGLVVACTMFGFYSLFRRGSIGGNE
jgi:multicomponent Na+:H+ antiporter subunit B